MNKGKRSIGFSPTKNEIKQGKLLNDLQKCLYDLNTPLLLIHSSYGALLKISIYS